MKVVIMQPFYLPWMGYFALMSLADVYVFYDDVQFVLQSWQSRNQIKTGNGVQWLTVPVEREFGQKINQVKIKGFHWKDDHIKTIEQTYSKAPHFETYWEYLSRIYEVDWLYLSELTIYSIRQLAELLNIGMPKFIKSSELGGIQGQKTDRILSILEKLEADEYISGPAAKDYINEDKFKGIKLTWFDYQHPIYPQIRGEFIPYMSVIDLLFNTGEEAIDYIREGIK